MIIYIYDYDNCYKNNYDFNKGDIYEENDINFNWDMKRKFYKY